MTGVFEAYKNDRANREKIKIAVFVSGGGTNLASLLKEESLGNIPHGQIDLVISNREDAYALERARESGKKTVYIKSDKKNPDLFENKALALLKENEIDLLVLAGFLSILSPTFISKYPDRILNIHPSLIPAFCGPGYYGIKVHEKALERGVKVSGATVHMVNEVTDGGKIIMQKAVPVLEGDSPESLQKRIMEEAEWVLLPKAVEKLSKKIFKERERKTNAN